VEFAPPKVRVNAIAPAVTMTDHVRGRFEAGNARVTKIASVHLIGLIEPEDIANMAVFLASDEAQMVTGHVYPVDSGITVVPISRRGDSDHLSDRQIARKWFKRRR